VRPEAGYGPAPLRSRLELLSFAFTLLAPVFCAMVSGCEDNDVQAVEDPPVCDPACTDGKECVEGACSCLKTTCGQSCVDSTSDGNNCGQCGNACGDYELCAQGSCVCALHFKKCGDHCVDVSKDHENCGDCGHVCPMGIVCEKAECHGCALGFTSCPPPGPECRDLSSDETSCGACGLPCHWPASTCCSGHCADFEFDVHNCGSCGVECTPPIPCKNGTCGGP
jgi:hypothetical protein